MRITRRRLGGDWTGAYGILLGLVGTMVFVFMPFPWSLLPGAPVLAMAVLLGFGNEKVELDLTTMRYRTYFSFFGSSGGAFKVLPELDHIHIRDFRETWRRKYGGMYRVELSLVTKDMVRLVICWSVDHDAAVQHAATLHRLSGLPIIDTTNNWN